ncbi:MAG: hypothetical protein WC641_07730 [Patescibacteria group bacterium]
MNPFKEQVALNLYYQGAAKFGKFRLKLHEKNPDAPLSPIYLNLRTPANPKPGPLTAEVVGMIAVLMAALTRELKYKPVCGVPNAGDPFAEAFYALEQDKLSGLIHLGKSEAGGRRFVSSIMEGGFSKGETVLLLDDLITKADSKFEAIQVLESDGLIVKDVVVLVDREQGGEAELAAKGYRLHSAFTLRWLVNFYAVQGLISMSMLDEVLDYLQANS